MAPYGGIDLHANNSVIGKKGDRSIFNQQTTSYAVDFDMPIGLRYDQDRMS